MRMPQPIYTRQKTGEANLTVHDYQTYKVTKAFINIARQTNTYPAAHSPQITTYLTTIETNPITNIIE